MKAIRNRGKIVVVDPRFTETAAKSDQHIFIKPGTDVWLLLAMVREVLEQKALNLNHLTHLVSAEQINLLKKIIAPYNREMAG